MLKPFSRRSVPGVAVGLVVLDVWSISAGSGVGADPRDLARVLQNAPKDLVVNAEGDTYDSNPSLVVAPDGSVRMAWHAYHLGHDRTLARRLSPGEPGPVTVIDGESKRQAMPLVVAPGHGPPWVFWASYERMESVVFPGVELQAAMLQCRSPFHQRSSHDITHQERRTHPV